MIVFGFWGMVGGAKDECINAGCGLEFAFVRAVANVNLYTESELEEVNRMQRLADSTMAQCSIDDLDNDVPP